LQIHPNNGHYLYDGQVPVLLTGYPNLVPTRVTDPAGETAQDQINRMHSFGIKYTRVWHQGAGSYWPWTRLPFDGQGCHGLDRWDFSGWGPEYWSRMTGALSYASQNCITSQVMLFNKSGLVRGYDLWDSNAWNDGNNINQLGTPGCGQEGVPEFYDSLTGNPTLLNYQRSYVEQMISQTAAKDVIYEIENEHRGPDGGWGLYWGAFIKASTTRLVSYSREGSQGSLFDFLDGSNPQNNNINILNYHANPTSASEVSVIGDDVRRGWWNDTTPPAPPTRRTYVKPINVDEVNGGDATILRRVAWTVITSGGHFHLEDPQDPLLASTLAVVDNVKQFLGTSFDPGTPWNFIGSFPNPWLSTEPTCMAYETGAAGARDYVCYVTQDHSATGVLLRQMPAGKYYVRWWSPRAIVFDRSSYAYYEQHPGGDLWTRPTPPDSPGVDWVLLVRNQLPDSPPAAYDLSITKDDTYALALLGQSVTYTIKVTNPSSSGVSGATVSDTFPANLQGVTWTCTGTPGASCTACGTGNISQQVNLPAGSSVTFMATGTKAVGRISQTLTNTAQVQHLSDPNTENNVATDVDVPGGIQAVSNFYTLTPCRLVDTRELGAAIGGPILMGGRTRDFAVIGRCGIPSGAKALRLNVTATKPSSAGLVRLAPTGDSPLAAQPPRTMTSTVNYSAGLTRGNNALVTLSADGKVTAYVGQPPGTVVHLIIDVDGYFQ